MKVAAPPEDGKANAAVCALLASALGLRLGSVTIVSGHTSALKAARVAGMDADRARVLLTR